jgi:hypothetical protein
VEGCRILAWQFREKVEACQGQAAALVGQSLLCVRARPARDVWRFGRGRALDMTEFLWASLALFDDEQPADTTTAYRPAPLALHTVAQARERILRRLSEQPDGAPLAELLPVEAPNADDASRRALLRRSGWAATFVAGLELAKQGEVVLGQGDDFEPIHVDRA